MQTVYSTAGIAFDVQAVQIAIQSGPERHNIPAAYKAKIDKYLKVLQGLWITDPDNPNSVVFWWIASVKIAYV